MRRLTKRQCLDWMAAHNVEEEDDGHHFLPTKGSAFVLDFTQPQSSRGNAVLARRIAEAVHDGESLLFVAEWGVWPTEESWPLFEKAMIGYGDARPLRDAPGFLFGPDEQEDLTAIVRFALISGWSGAVLSATRPIGYSLTDDDWVGVFAESESAVRQWITDQFLVTFDVEVLWEGELQV